MTAPKNPRPSGPTERRALNLGLPGLSTEDAIERIIEGVEDGRVSVREGVDLTTIYKVRLVTKDAKELLTRVMAAEAAHRAMLDATRKLAPARRQIVNFEPVEVGQPSATEGSRQ